MKPLTEEQVIRLHEATTHVTLAGRADGASGCSPVRTIEEASICRYAIDSDWAEDEQQFVNSWLVQVYNQALNEHNEGK